MITFTTLEDSRRQRLLQGIEAAILEKGYADTTVIDIVRHAGVSKRTFYEFFADKRACLLDFYRQTNQSIVDIIDVVARTSDDVAWDMRLLQGMKDFFNRYQQSFTVLNSLMLEIRVAGREGLALHRETQQQYCDMLMNLVERERSRFPNIRPLPPVQAAAILGGIQEILLNAYEQDQSSSLSEQLEPLSGFVSTMLRGLGLGATEH